MTPFGVRVYVCGFLAILLQNVFPSFSKPSSVACKTKQATEKGLEKTKHVLLLCRKIARKPHTYM